MIPALAFEKNEEREKSFELIVEEITNVTAQQHLDSFVIEKKDELCLYQVSTIEPSSYIYPQIWNQRDVAIEGITRIANAVERWYYGIQVSFSGSHPGIWKLLVNLQKDASGHKLNFWMPHPRKNIQKRRSMRAWKVERCRTRLRFTGRKLRFIFSGLLPVWSVFKTLL